jgi:DNA-directed RNA polymerase specialized sigma24 family protein
MRKEQVSAKPPDLREAMRSANWEELMPQLWTYALHRLRRVGWAGGSFQESGKMSADDLVQTAIRSCLDGTRGWDPSAVDLRGLLCGIIRSLTSSERKKYVRAKTVTSTEATEIHSGSSDSAEDDIVAEENRREVEEAFAACTADDLDLDTLWKTILDGHTKREDIARELGWPLTRVDVARKKLQRRVARLDPQRFGDVVTRRRTS